MVYLGDKRCDSLGPLKCCTPNAIVTGVFYSEQLLPNLVSVLPKFSFHFRKIPANYETLGDVTSSCCTNEGQNLVGGLDSFPQNAANWKREFCIEIDNLCPIKMKDKTRWKWNSYLRQADCAFAESAYHQIALYTPPQWWNVREDKKGTANWSQSFHYTVAIQLFWL